MNRTFLERMSVEEIEEYAKFLDIDLRPAETKDEKIALLERKRNRCARVSALGLDFEIPMKRIHDKRLVDLEAKDSRSEAETFEMIRLFLGDEQSEMLLKACTDEDGTVDSVALGVAFVKIYTSEELKNF